MFFKGPIYQQFPVGPRPGVSHTGGPSINPMTGLGLILTQPSGISNCDLPVRMLTSEVVWRSVLAWREAWQGLMLANCYLRFGHLHGLKLGKIRCGLWGSGAYSQGDKLRNSLSSRRCSDNQLLQACEEMFWAAVRQHAVCTPGGLLTNKNM